MSTTTRVNLVSLLALLFLVLGRGGHSRGAPAHGPPGLLGGRGGGEAGGEPAGAGVRRRRHHARGEGRGRESEEEASEPAQLPPHVVRAPNGQLYPEPGYKWINDDPNDHQRRVGAGAPSTPSIPTSSPPTSPTSGGRLRATTGSRPRGSTTCAWSGTRASGTPTTSMSWRRRRRGLAARAGLYLGQRRSERPVGELARTASDTAIRRTPP